jgi:hypothetical protein
VATGTVLTPTVVRIHGYYRYYWYYVISYPTSTSGEKFGRFESLPSCKGLDSLTLFHLGANYDQRPVLIVRFYSCPQELLAMIELVI